MGKVPNSKAKASPSFSKDEAYLTSVIPRRIALFESIKAEQQAHRQSIKIQMASTSMNAVVNTQVISAGASEKPPKFGGTDFKRWQQKMLFYLTTLNLAKFLKETTPVVGDRKTNNDKIVVADAWNHSDFLCKNYILNGLCDTLYSVYSNVKTPKLLWESLESKYKIEDASTKKFIVGHFLEFMMVDSKSVVTQAEELQSIYHDIHAEGMSLSESFQVAALIEKLPPSWKDFKSYLKHKKKEISLEYLILRLRIEEDNRKAEHGHVDDPKANVVEIGTNNKKRKHGDCDFNKQSSSKKFKGKCYNCDKPGHWAKDCRNPKKKKKAHDVNKMNFCV